MKGIFLGLALLFAWTFPLPGQSLTWLGTLPGHFRSEAYGVSEDGMVVVGTSSVSLFLNFRAFRWTASSGMANLGTLGGSESEARDVSADGLVVVGQAEDGSGNGHAFRWTASGGMMDLGTFGGIQSMAWGVSADGAVVVGWASDPSFNYRAFRWTSATGLVDLGTLGGSESEARDVSADGSVVVGEAYNAAGNAHAFRWTASGGMMDLGTLGGSSSRALSVSSDGQVVVGWALNASGSARAFRWTSSSGMTDLGTLGGSQSMAWGVSASGDTIVGWAEDPSGNQRAFRWTPTGGMEDLNQTYATLVGNSLLSVAYDISPDGRYIVGQGHNAATGQDEAFLLDTGMPTALAEPNHDLSVPREFALHQNYPNPFNGETIIRYALAHQSAVSLQVFDMAGRLVQTLVQGVQGPGNYRVRFVATGLPGGVYFYRLQAGAFRQTRKLILLK